MDSEKLNKYIKDNQPTKSKTESKETPVSYKLAPQKAGDFFTFFRLLNGVNITIPFLIAVVMVSFAGFKALGVRDISLSERMLWLLVGVFTLVALYLLFYVVQFLPYKKFLSNKLYPVQGWNDFVSGLSPAFWKDSSRYVYINLSITPQPKATAAHRDAILIFLDKCTTRWGTGHEGKWLKGSPTNLRREGFSLAGHICIRFGSPFLIRTLLYHLPEFVDIMGADNVIVSISRRGEQSFDTEEEDNSDPYEAERERKRWESD